MKRARNLHVCRYADGMRFIWVHSRGPLMRNTSGWITNSGDHDELSNIAGVTFLLAQYFATPHVQI